MVTLLGFNFTISPKAGKDNTEFIQRMASTLASLEGATEAHRAALQDKMGVPILGGCLAVGGGNRASSVNFFFEDKTWVNLTDLTYGGK